MRRAIEASSTARRVATAGLITALLASHACNPVVAQMRRLAARGDTQGALTLYAQHARDRGASNADALAAVASEVLRRACESTDALERGAGFVSVRGLGARAREILVELRGRPGVVGDRAAATLYEIDGREGAPPERLFEAARAVNDPERRAIGLLALEARRDVVGLLAALESTSSEVRRVAATRLARFRAEAEVTRALAQRAREDRDELVRVAAINALALHGEPALETLEAMLDERVMPLRMAAVSALVQASRTRAIERLEPMMQTPRSALSIEIARVLASRGHPAAIEFVLAALEDPSANLRAQAAVAVGSLGDEQARRAAPHIEDADPEVRVRVCGALIRHDAFRERVVRSMRALATSVDPRLAVRALLVLSDADDGAISGPLREALRAPDASVRRLALLAWSRLAGHTGEVDPLAPLLTDADRGVRLMAAAEIVRIASR